MNLHSVGLTFGFIGVFAVINQKRVNCRTREVCTWKLFAQNARLWSRKQHVFASAIPNFSSTNVYRLLVNSGDYMEACCKCASSNSGGVSTPAKYYSNHFGRHLSVCVDITYLHNTARMSFAGLFFIFDVFPHLPSFIGDSCAPWSWHLWFDSYSRFLSSKIISWLFFERS